MNDHNRHTTDTAGFEHQSSTTVFLRTTLTQDDRTRQATDTPGFKHQSPTTGFFKAYTHMDDHTEQTTGTPGFKPFTVNPRVLTSWYDRCIMVRVYPKSAFIPK